MQGRMINTPRQTQEKWRGGQDEENQTGNDNDRPGADSAVFLLPRDGGGSRDTHDDDDTALEAVARLSSPGPERRETLTRITPAGWQTLSELVAVLASIATRVGVDDELRWRVAALQRAVDSHDPSPFPLALGSTGREPPPAVIAWSHERATVEDLPEVAVWFLADAACELAEGAGIEELRGAWAMLHAWASAVSR